MVVAAVRGILLAALLVAAALVAPVPLYLASLALFGLPHVVWELGYLRSRFGTRWTRTWWRLLAAVLLIEAGVRTAYWAGWMHGQAAQVADLLALLLTGVVVALAPRGMGWPARLAGAAFALTLLWLLQHGEVVPALLLLSIAHNFTPLALGWERARGDASARPLAWRVTALFALPLLVAALPATLTTTVAWLPAGLSAPAGLLEGQLLPGWGGAHRPSWLSALVVAQCLHYYCVIRLLPQAQQARLGLPVLPSAARHACLVAAGCLVAYWLVDWSAARQLYAVAAGVHAWLEWPLLLMAWTSRAEPIPTGHPRPDRAPNCDAVTTVAQGTGT